ncbi:putative ribonuclease H-like domain-containing protein [Tanacetum coccineum]
MIAEITMYLTSQPNSPKLARENLEQIDPDDLEEMDLQWEMAMLTIRARRFIQRTGRKLDVNGQRVGFDRTKVECTLFHKYGYFARACRVPINLENISRENNRRTVTVETPTENALVAQDGLGGSDSGGEYDIWAMKMEHYLAHTDYLIWEVIQNGNGPVSVTTDTSGQIKILPPKTAEEIVARERERKARTTLLMAITEDHLAKIQSSCPQLDHEDLEQLDEYDLEEMNLKWQVAMISMRMKKFYKKAGRKLQFDAKEPCGESVDWTNTHSEDDEDYALMAGNNSGSDTKIQSKDEIICNTAKASSTNNFSTARQNVNRQTVLTSTALKVNTVKPIVNGVPYRPSKWHMQGTRSYLADFQDFNGGAPSTFRGSKGYITGYIGKNNNGIKREYSQNAKSQQNGVAERRTGPYSIVSKRPCFARIHFYLTLFGAEAVSTACFVLNRELLSKGETIIRTFIIVYLLVSFNMNPRRISEALYEEESWLMLCMKNVAVWIQNLVPSDLPYGKKAIVARLEAIRIFLAFASYMGFIVYQMDVKSAFLYGKIDEEVYVSQPPGFLDPKYPEKVYKVVKALYGLHQAPRAWIDESRSRFQMSSMGELTFFLGLQVKQKPDGIFISQDKYVAEILKKFDFASVKTASTPIETQKPLVKDEKASDVDVYLYRSMIGSLMYLKGKPKLGLWYPRVSSFDLESYSDSDYAGANLDRKSTTGAVWKSHVCITRKSWPLFKSKKIAQVVRARIQSKNSLVKHFEDMRLCRPSKEYLPVWFDPPRDESMSCLTTKGMRNIGAMCASIPDTYIVHSLFGQMTVPLSNNLIPFPKSFPRPSPTPIVPDSIQNLLAFRSSQGQTTLEGYDQQDQETSSPAKEFSDEQEQSTEGHFKVTQTLAAEIFTKLIEIISKVLLTWSSHKPFSREKEKGVSREVEDAEQDTRLRVIKDYGEENSREWEVRRKLRQTDFLHGDASKSQKREQLTIEKEQSSFMITIAARENSCSTKIRGHHKTDSNQESIKYQSSENFIGFGSVDGETESLIKRMNKKDSPKSEETVQCIGVDTDLSKKVLDDLECKDFSNPFYGISGSSSISKNPQNVAFVSSNSTNINSSTNEADNTTYGVSAAHTQINPTSGDNLSDVVICLKWSATIVINMVTLQENVELLEIRKTEEERLIEELQFIDKFKTGLGCNAASSTTTSPAVESFVNSTEMLENQENNKSKSDKGYHAVPPRFTVNFMPRKPDLTFMDEIVESENLDVTTVVTPSNVKAVESNHKSANVKSNSDAVEPKTVRMNSFIPPVIEDWNSDDESEVEIIPKDKTVSSSTEKIKLVKSARETVEKVIRPVWNNSSRVNHKNFANKMTHPHPNRRFVPQAVLTKSGKINTAGASVNTAVRPVNTAGSKPTVNHPRPISNAYKKGYSQVTRPFNKYSANKNSIFNKKVNTVRVKDTTARDRAVVSQNKGKGLMLLRPQHAGFGKPKIVVHQILSRNILTLMHEADPSL